MSILQFDDDRLRRHLTDISHHLRAAFAAACTERMLPAYMKFAQRSSPGDGPIVRDILDDLWTQIKRGRVDLDTLSHHVQTCELLIPHEDPSGTGYAQDTGIALVCALKAALTGDLDDAIWPARLAWDLLDDHVIHILKIEVNAPGAQKAIESHPTVQAEFRRQRADMEALQVAAKNRAGAPGIIESIRRRAQDDARSFFGS
jgi:uncharacterized protein YjaG (DUF416 family)